MSEGAVWAARSEKKARREIRFHIQGRESHLRILSRTWMWSDLHCRKDKVGQDFLNKT